MRIDKMGMLGAVLAGQLAVASAAWAGATVTETEIPSH